jgi:hypothetical protein
LCVECVGQVVGSSRPKLVLVGQTMGTRPPRLCQPQLHCTGEVLPARPALPPSIALFAVCHAMSSILCPTLDVCEPCITAACAPRLDWRRVIAQADDARTAVRCVRSDDVIRARRGGGRAPLCGGSDGPLAGCSRRALHSCLWPPSFQCTFWNSTEQ